MTPEPKYPESIILRMTEKMFKALRRAAEKEYLTVSDYLRKIIREATDSK